ncbi:3-oxoacyl-[acyl-carrier-protein] reductase FabG [Allostella sp. ATCC 35155]|nr:3-oxoacyl-[acyl-carrier-protein] reductase FabG [Stella sp. ATCC 35155]
MSADTSKPLAGRAAIVTGSGRNLGRGMILAFAGAGANVVVNGHRDRDAVERVAEEARALGVEALAVMADVSQPEECERLVAETVAAFGSADIAVANVGLRPRQAFLEISVEDWRRVIETNLSSAFYLARAVLPEMKKRKWGRIVHISGRDGFFTISHRAHNVTCKAGLHSLAKAIAIEFGEFGITANTIAPGKMDTTRDEKNYPGYREAWAEAVKATPLRRLGTAEDVGEACLYLACGGEYVTGQLLHLNGGEFLF